MMPKTSLSIHTNEWALWKDTGSVVENQVLLLKKKSSSVITLNELSLSLNLCFSFLSFSLCLSPDSLTSCSLDSPVLLAGLSLSYPIRV